jgi:hypothetical protein
MQDATKPQARSWHRLSGGDLLFCLAVIAAYVIALAVSIHWRHFPTDRMMTLAEQAIKGQLDSDAIKGTVDSVDIGGRYFLAVGPLQLLPYLPFALLGVFQNVAGHIIGIAVGIPTALLALPLARAYGARGRAAYWVAGFAACGTLLLFVSVFGDFYYLAHAESFLALTLFLIEWAGRRRPAVLSACLAVSFLARPTTVLAAVPFGLALLWQRRETLSRLASTVAGFAIPTGFAIAVYGWFNWLRFGSPFEAGYAISYVIDPALEARRQLGVFSIVQIPENIRLALFALPQRIDHFPFFTADRFGMSMLLVSPALVTSAWAGIRDRSAQLLWTAAAIVAIPVFLYYGGGANQYGFRYALDFTPFLIALVALGSSRWKGWPEHVLIVASVASIAYGVLWHSMVYLQS